MIHRMRGAAAVALAAAALAGCSDASPSSDEPPFSPDGSTAEDAGKDGAHPGADSGDDDDAGDDDASVNPHDGGGGGGHLFGSHSFPYAAGTIFPSDSQTARDTATAQFYDAWKAKYLIKDCGPGRYYIATTLDGSGGGQGATSITVSEGHGYGMVIAAMMAGHDPDARTIYDGLYLFFRDHPSVNSPDLMAWNQVKGCQTEPKDGTDSATDGDLDIAFSLLLASRQWSGGTIDYAAEAKKVIAAVLAHDVNATTKLVTLGDWDDSSDTVHYFGTRPSDFMLDHFRAFGAATGDATWKAVVDAHYGLVSKVQSGISPNTGLLPDFVIDTNTTPKAAGANFLEGNNDGDYFWNSCRVPWRLGTDGVVTGEARNKTALAKINTWIRGAAHEDPTKIVAGYHMDGTTAGSADNSIAFVAPFGVSAMVDASNQAWLDAIWKLLVSRKVSDDNYFGNSIKMQTMLVMSGNWWEP